MTKLNDLSPELRELLFKRLSQRKASTQHLTITRQSHLPDRSPLSFAQEQLWFLHQLEPDVSYTMSMIRQINGKLSMQTLEKSVEEVVQRHGALRTFFELERGQATQVVLPLLPLPCKFIDLSACLTHEQLEVTLRLLEEEIQQPFDLSQPPLWRLHLFRLSAKQHILALTIHHIIADGWSLTLFLEELSQCYQAFYQQRPSPLPPTPLQYIDFACWQREQYQKGAWEHHLRFWREQLANASSVLDLPPGPSRLNANTSSPQGGQVSFRLPAHLLEQLRALSLQEECTLFMALLAAFQTLLLRYTGQHDLVVGTPIAQRHLPELQEVIGHFVNMLPLRVRLQEQWGFRQVMRHVRQVTLDAYEHQELPFELLVSAVHHERNSSYQPLFQVAFVFQSLISHSLHLGEAQVETMDIPVGTARFNLTLAMTEEPFGISGTLDYRVDRYEREAMQRLLEHLGRLLEAVVSQPDQPVGTLPLLSATEEHLLLERWNPAEQPEAVVACLHEQFAQQASRTPDAIALQLDETQLSYQQLDHQANQLAWYLRSQGVGPEVLVGLCLPRSFELIIGLLAILKAGGAYVPLDPGYPAERLAFMVTDAQLKLVLSSRQTRQVLPLGQVRCLEVEGQWGWEAGGVQEAPESGVRADNLAYVIYTSGSTGHPKGTLVSHLNVERLFAATVERLSLSARDTWTLFHSFSFDFSVWEIWGALLQGGRLVVVPHALARSPDDFLKALSRFQVTVLNQTPSAFRALDAAESGEERPLPLSLRLLIFGGEALSPAWLQGWFKRHPDDAPTVINMYGITETTVHVTLRQMRAQELPHLSGSPIGQALADLHLYLLDERMQLVPIGVPGELYIGGPGLARGYLCRPELTAERFLPHPFSSLPGARLYRSGDLARYLPDGELFYLGRADQQLKIRGFRIEPGEIESCLRAHAAIRDALVMAREAEPPAPAQLVAYLLLRHLDSAPALESLREFVQERLPQFMVPASFVFLTDFPLTASGKVDRRALPAPESQRAQLQTAYVAPRTPVEEALAQIWAEVLHVERVGVADNFFALGGDSIHSVQIAARAGQLGYHFAVKQVFAHQTIAELATVVTSPNAISTEQAIISGSVPLTPIQHWFFENHVHYHHFNQSVLLNCLQPLDLEHLKQAVQHLVMHHDALRLRFFHSEESWQQMNKDKEEHQLVSLFDLSQQSIEEQDWHIAKCASSLQGGLDLSTGPLLRVALFRCGSRAPDRLLIIIHHLCVDVVSWHILLEDLQTAYLHISRRQTVVLPSKTTSFKQWAECLVEYANSGELQREFPYWYTVLNDTPRLPKDYPEGKNDVKSEQTVTVRLTMEETQTLLHGVYTMYQAYPQEVLLTAVGQAFARWTGKQSLLVDIESHGRETSFEHINTTRTVGWFTTLYPVRIDNNQQEAEGMLRTVKEQLRQVPHHGIGYGLLRYMREQDVEQVRLRQLAGAQVCFNYVGQVDTLIPHNTLWQRCDLSSGPEQSPDAQRAYLIDIHGRIAEKRLDVKWTYSPFIYHASTIEMLAQAFLAALRDLLECCQSSGFDRYAPSDFPQAQLNSQQLEDVFADIHNLGVDLL